MEKKETPGKKKTVVSVVHHHHHHSSKVKHTGKEENKKSKEKKGKKKWERKHTLRLVLAVCIIALIVSVHTYIQSLYKTGGLTEYHGSCFIRSFSAGTGLNTIQNYQLIPSDKNSKLLSTLQITKVQFELLGGDTKEEESNFPCKGDVLVLYSPYTLKVESLDLQ